MDISSTPPPQQFGENRGHVSEQSGQGFLSAIDQCLLKLKPVCTFSSVILALRVLKKLRRMCCLCNYIYKGLDILVCSDKDEKTVGSVSCIFNVTWFAGDGKELAHLSQRVGNVVPGDVAWSCCSGLLLNTGITSLQLLPLGQIGLFKIKLSKSMSFCVFAHIEH